MTNKFEIKEKEGSLFNNAKNKKTENHPDYTGSCVIGGVKMNISAWINEAKTTGKKYMRLKFDEYQALQGDSNTTSAPEFEDSEAQIPFQWNNNQWAGLVSTHTLGMYSIYQPQNSCPLIKREIT